MTDALTLPEHCETCGQWFVPPGEKDVRAFFVLYSDGTWAGGFSSGREAREVCRKNGGQVVRGVWFDD